MRRDLESDDYPKHILLFKVKGVNRVFFGGFSSGLEFVMMGKEGRREDVGDCKGMSVGETFSGCYRHY